MPDKNGRFQDEERTAYIQEMKLRSFGGCFKAREERMLAMIYSRLYWFCGTLAVIFLDSSGGGCSFLSAFIS